MPAGDAGTLPAMPRLLGLLLPAALLLAACGDDEPATQPAPSTAPSTSGPATTEAPADEEEDTASDQPADDPDPDDADPDDAGPDAPAIEPPTGTHLDEGMGDVLLVAEPAGPDGVEGRFEAELVDGTLCADLVVRGLGAPATDAHIRPAPGGEPLASFGAPTAADGDASRWDDACTELDDDAIDALASGLDHHHVAVTTAAAPDGAAAGALGVATVFDRTLRQP